MGLQVCEWVYLIIFTVEMFSKILAYGFLFNKEAYLKDAWCQLDITVVSLAWLPSERNVLMLPPASFSLCCPHALFWHQHPFLPAPQSRAYCHRLPRGTDCFPFGAKRASLLRVSPARSHTPLCAHPRQ